MATGLEAILEQLELQEYLKRFLEAGFTSWEHLTNITEDQLASLDVKLGHRRRLQRAVARARQWPDHVALPMTPELWQRIIDWQRET